MCIVDNLQQRKSRKKSGYHSLHVLPAGAVFRLYIQSSFRAQCDIKLPWTKTNSVNIELNTFLIILYYVKKGGCGASCTQFC